MCCCPSSSSSMMVSHLTALDYLAYVVSPMAAADVLLMLLCDSQPHPTRFPAPFSFTLSLFFHPFLSTLFLVFELQQSVSKPAKTNQYGYHADGPCDAFAGLGVPHPSAATWGHAQLREPRLHVVPGLRDRRRVHPADAGLCVVPLGVQGVCQAEGYSARRESVFPFTFETTFLFFTFHSVKSPICLVFSLLTMMFVSQLSSSSDG